MPCETCSLEGMVRVCRGIVGYARVKVRRVLQLLIQLWRALHGCMYYELRRWLNDWHAKEWTTV